MQFRDLLPMLAEMQKHRAQMILREISIVRLSQADRKDFNARAAITDLERQAGRDEEPEQISQSLDAVRSMFRGMEEV